MPVTVDLIHAPACARCADSREALRQAAQTVAGEALIWRDLDVIEHLDYAVSLGVLTVPAVAINGRLVFSSLPTSEQLQRALQDPAILAPSDGR
jgi:thioredoxin-like negative regulator of GroEL